MVSVRAASVRAFAALGLDLVPGSGLLAACVPGAFGAWMLLLREYGTLRLRDVMGYAIGYAASGYPVLPALYIVLAGWICIVLLRYKPQYTWPGLVLVLLGIPVYFLWSLRSSNKV